MNIYKQRNTKIATGIIISLMIFDLVINYFSSQGSYAPWIANFMSASGEGHIAQITLWYFTPLIILLLISEIGFEKKVNGLLNVELLRDKNAVYKLLVKVIIVSGTVFVVALIINFILSLLVFHGQTFDKSLSEVIATETNSSFLSFKWQVSTPYVTLLIYAIINLVYWLSIAIFTFGLGLIVNKKIELYVVSLVCYYIILMVVNPLITIQPFTEFPFFLVSGRYFISILALILSGLGSIYVYSKGNQL